MQTLIKCLSGDTIIFGISPELVVGLEVVLAYFWDDVNAGSILYKVCKCYSWLFKFTLYFFKHTRSFFNISFLPANDNNLNMKTFSNPIKNLYCKICYVVLYALSSSRGEGVVRFVDISGLVHSESYNLNLDVEDLMMSSEPDIKYGILFFKTWQLYRHHT